MSNIQTTKHFNFLFVGGNIVVEFIPSSVQYFEKKKKVRFILNYLTIFLVIEIVTVFSLKINLKKYHGDTHLLNL